MKEGDIIAGKYELVRMIGLGSAGSVYEARHTQLDHRVALKFLRSELRTDTEAVERFFREAKAAAGIGSEHIAAVSDMGQDTDGVPFLVMEYIEGRTLAKAMREKRHFDFERAAHITVQLCRALAAAHDKGIIHRDMKPDNVILVPREDGSELVKVLDFGIAKIRGPKGAESRHLTATGTTLGTPHYMAPEQARAEKDMDGRADVYSIGVILYEMLTGQLPFSGSTFTDIIVKATTTDPAPPSTIREDIPRELEAVVLKAMYKDRNIRHSSARELAEALTPFLPSSERLSLAVSRVSIASDAPIKGPPTAKLPKAVMPQPIPQESGKLKLVVILGAAILIVVIIGGAIGGWVLYHAGLETGAAQSGEGTPGAVPGLESQPSVPHPPLPTPLGTEGLTAPGAVGAGASAGESKPEEETGGMNSAPVPQPNTDSDPAELPQPWFDDASLSPGAGEKRPRRPADDANTEAMSQLRRRNYQACLQTLNGAEASTEGSVIRVRCLDGAGQRERACRVARRCADETRYCRRYVARRCGS